MATASTHTMDQLELKMSASRPCRRRGRRINAQIRRGFTLLEIIVVVTIIAILATMIAPKLLQNIWKSKQKVAKAECASIAQQVGLYLADNGLSTPGQDFDLNLLTEGTSPYLEAKDLQDPWGNPYLIRIPGIEHPSGFDIVSYGGDGQPGGEGENADIVN